MEAVPQQIGPYQIVEEIGRGSVAIVYRATDTLYERAVALKVLPAYFAHDPAFVRHFISEGREAMRLRHPNIVQVFDAGQADGFNYIAEELVTGGTLNDLLRAQGSALPYDMTVAIVEQLAAGLDYAHHQGYIHRNLTPNNILFGEHGQVKLADFSGGAPPRSLRSTNYPISFPAFMSPEQARGDEVDRQSDIYSLGVIAYLMLTGKLPFEADNPLVLLRKIIEDPPPLLETVNPQIPFGVAYAVHQALSKQPALRHSTTAAFAHALAQNSSFTSQAETKPETAVSTSDAGTASNTPGAALPTAKRERTAVPPRKTPRVLSIAGGALATTLVALFLITIVQARTTLFDQFLDLEKPIPPADVMARTTPNAAQLVVAADQKVRNIAFADTPLPTLAVLATPTATPQATPTLAPTLTPPDTETPTATQPATETPLATETAAPTTAVEAPTPVASAPTGRIAYSVWNPHTDRYDVHIYNFNNGVTWPEIPNKRQPDFNIQGDLAANSEGGNMDNLVFMGPNGENPQTISVYAQDSRPHWSASGKALVFDSDLVGNGSYRLYLLPATEFGHRGPALRYDAWELIGRYPVFLANERIAYNGCNVWENGSVCGLYTVDTGGGKPENVTNWPGDIPTDNLGSQILVTSNRDNNWDVYLVNPVGSVVQRLTQGAGHNGLATASPNGNYIAFATDREGKWSIYLMRPDGSDQHKLFDLEQGYAGGEHDWLQERLSWGR
ncbi:MAG: protein kinase [Caldilineaceae bacterium]